MTRINTDIRIYELEERRKEEDRLRISRAERQRVNCKRLQENIWKEGLALALERTHLNRESGRPANRRKPPKLLLTRNLGVLSRRKVNPSGVGLHSGSGKSVVRGVVRQGSPRDLSSVSRFPESLEEILGLFVGGPQTVIGDSPGNSDREVEVIESSGDVSGPEKREDVEETNSEDTSVTLPRHLSFETACDGERLLGGEAGISLDSKSSNSEEQGDISRGDEGDSRHLLQGLDTKSFGDMASEFSGEEGEVLFNNLYVDISSDLLRYCRGIELHNDLPPTKQSLVGDCRLHKLGEGELESRVEIPSRYLMAGGAEHLVIFHRNGDYLAINIGGNFS